ncbi:MAG: HAD hydrolase family protein [FCB group bacterium]|nr:HAD hydrolase family protein [FCB group bacterium]
MKISLEQIELVVYDFDGVMTDNRVMVDEEGREAVVVNRGDGLAVAELRRLKIRQIILSTEKNPVVSRRAEKLKIPCLQGSSDKKDTLIKHLKKHNINKEQVIYFGNDINDLEVMQWVGFSIAPADAHPEIKKIADLILSSGGGEGVIREFLDLIRNP